MEVRRLHLHNLRHMDVAVVRVFLQLLDQGHGACPQIRWVLSEDDAADLVLLPPDDPQAADLTARTPASAWVIGRNDPVPDGWIPSLRRPLQLEDFTDLLRQVSTTCPPAPDAPRPVPAPPEPAAAPASGGTAVVTCWRLRRWPPARALEPDPRLRRLAAFLSSRYLSVAELAAQSRIDSPTCASFIHTLEALDLLDRRVAVGQADPGPVEAPQAGAQAAPQPTPAPPPPTGARSVTRTGAGLPGLLTRLRQHLGLVGSAG